VTCRPQVALMTRSAATSSARAGAAGVPEAAIEARTLADVGQGRESAEAADTAVATPAVPRRARGRNANEQLQRRR
jgi:hypothetical protein